MQLTIYAIALEGILRDRTYMDLEMIGDSQYGFMRGKSYLTNLTELFEVVTKKDGGNAVDIVCKTL